jgi:superfamily II DNA helicase RecQ
MLSSLQMEGLTIVVSPLISLIEDQMKKLPIELPAAWFIFIFIFIFLN